MKGFTASLTVLVATCAGLSMGAPGKIEERMSKSPRASSDDSYEACSGLFSNAVCCDTDVLGIANLNCETVPKMPTSAGKFSKMCADNGHIARCCVLPLLGQGILCSTPTGVDS